MVKEVIRTDGFLRKLNKLDRSVLIKVDKLIVKVLNSPEIGKPMRFDRKETKELYVNPFRLNYIYDKTRDILIFLDVYHKDKQ